MIKMSWRIWLYMTNKYIDHIIACEANRLRKKHRIMHLRQMMKFPLRISCQKSFSFPQDAQYNHAIHAAYAHCLSQESTSEYIREQNTCW